MLAWLGIKTFVKTVQFNSKNISEDTDTYVGILSSTSWAFNWIFILWNITNRITSPSFLAQKFTITDYLYREERASVAVCAKSSRDLLLRCWFRIRFIQERTSKVSAPLHCDHSVTLTVNMLIMSSLLTLMLVILLLKLLSRRHQTDRPHCFF